MNTIKIKVIAGNKELQGKILNLVEENENVYRCIDNDIQIIDTWNELTLLNEYYKKTGCKLFYDMHLFSTSFGKELKFIDEVEFINIV